MLIQPLTALKAYLLAAAGRDIVAGCMPAYYKEKWRRKPSPPNSS